MRSKGKGKASPPPLPTQRAKSPGLSVGHSDHGAGGEEGQGGPGVGLPRALASRAKELGQLLLPMASYQGEWPLGYEGRGASWQPGHHIMDARSH